MNPVRWAKLLAKNKPKPKPKPKRTLNNGTEEWRALSTKDRLHLKTDPVKLRLEPLDIFGSRGKAHKPENLT